MSHDETKMAVETPSCRMMRPKWPLRRRRAAWWNQNGHWDAVMPHDGTKMAIETPSCRMTRSKWPLRRRRVAWRDQNGHWDAVVPHDDRTHVQSASDSPL